MNELDESAKVSIREAAERTGVSAHTLRYYERIGLLGRVPRDRSGHRRFGAADLRAITFLRKMQATGMPIRAMKAYAVLLRRGEGTEAARMELLVEHERRVRARLVELEQNLALIHQKIAMYGALVAPPEKTSNGKAR